MRLKRVVAAAICVTTPRGQAQPH